MPIDVDASVQSAAAGRLGMTPAGLDVAATYNSIRP